MKFHLLRPIFATLLITFCAMFLNTALSQDKKQGLRLSKTDPLELMIDKIPGFKERVKTCRRPERRVSFNDCLWDGDAKLNLSALPEKEREAISDYLKFKKNEDDERPKMGDSPLQMTEHVVTQKDPAVKSLEDYFSKKLRQALYGDVEKDLVKNVGKEIDPKKHKVVDHRVFHDIYENLVSKKIVADISSYCIRVDYSDNLYLLAEDEKKTIQTNKDRLSSEVERHSKEWDNCFVKLRETCYDNSAMCDDFDPNDPQQEEDHKSCQRRLDRSETKACMVMRSVRAARQALISNKQVMDAYSDNDKKGSISGSIALNHSNSDQVEVSAYDPNNKEVSPDKITTFSSGEILNEENEFMATNKKEIEKMAECYNDEAGKIVDPEACEDFLDTNRDEQQRAVAEVFVRGKAVSQQIEQMEDEDEIRDFLKEEGRSDDEVDALVEAYDNVDELRSEINKRYNKEQEALVEEMSALIDQTTADGEEVDPKKDLGTIKKLHRELTEREDTFKQMVHYNNVMASFLTIGNNNGEDEEQVRNTGMVIQEMENSAFNPELNEDSDKGADYFNQLTATLEETKSLEANENDAPNILLDVSKINEVILKYNRQPAEEKKNQ